VGFLIVNVTLWLFFRTSVRDIGQALYSRRIEEAILYITKYLGEPPSRVKAKMLTRMYNIRFVYKVDGKIIWDEGKADGEPMGRGMMGHHMGGMHRLFQREILYPKNQVLTVYLPMQLRKMNYFIPLYFLIIAISFMGVFVFLSVRKTLRPLDRIIEAAERLGVGDLSFRIRDTGDGEFGRVSRAINEMAERLQTMLSTQRELLHMVSHELRTPLTRINLALEMKDRNEAREAIKNEIHGIDALVEEVLDLSRMESKSREMARTSFDLVPVLEKLKGRYGAQKVRFRPEVGEAVISGYLFLVEKLFANLIENAVKYSDEAKTVIISLGEEGDAYRITITNYGESIPPGDLEKIWQPFYRGSIAKAKNTDGLGLGLVIVERAAQLSGGKVRVESRTEGTTTFTVLLPKRA
jgi:signal transduction histidine kinase